MQANANAGDMAKRLKHAEGSSTDMQRRIDELTVQLNATGGDNQRLQAELARLRTTVQELQDKNDALARENKQLSGASSLFCSFETFSICEEKRVFDIL